MLLPVSPWGRERLDDRRVLNGVVWKFRTGTARRDVPDRYGPWATLHTRFRLWALDGRFERMLRAAQARADAVGDINTTQWIRTVRRRIAPASGGLTDKGTQGKRARKVPIVGEIGPFVAQLILSAGPDPDARLFTGPRGGRISTAVLRDAPHWDGVVTKLGYGHLRRHDLRTPD